MNIFDITRKSTRKHYKFPKMPYNSKLTNTFFNMDIGDTFFYTYNDAEIDNYKQRDVARSCIKAAARTVKRKISVQQQTIGNEKGLIVTVLEVY